MAAIQRNGPVSAESMGQKYITSKTSIQRTDLIVSNLFYCTCTIRADVSAPCACLSCSLAFLLLYLVFLSKYMMMMMT